MRVLSDRHVIKRATAAASNQRSGAVVGSGGLPQGAADQTARALAQQRAAGVLVQHQRRVKAAEVALRALENESKGAVGRVGSVATSAEAERRSSQGSSSQGSPAAVQGNPQTPTGISASATGVGSPFTLTERDLVGSGS